MVGGEAFQVGDWTILPELNQIQRGSEVRHLEPKIMDVLVHLAQHPGQVLAKDRILEAVWPETFVGDDALVRAVAELRKAFSDDARKPSFIETVPKRGYRLIAEVSPSSGCPSGPSSEQQTDSGKALPQRTAAQEGKTGLLRPFWKIGVTAGAVMLILLAALVGSWMARESEPSTTPGKITSIAVLPLDNLMNDPGEDYFVLGMTDAIIADLSKISSLKVISRTSTMRYREMEKSIPEIARELNVDAVLEGSVMRGGNQVRITAQLLLGATDEHLWGENYVRDLSDILALQSEVAHTIARQIRVTLTPNEEARLSREDQVAPEAYELYLRGRYQEDKFAGEGMLKAVGLFEQSIAKDPLYAPAYAGLAEVYFLRSFGYASLRPHQAMPKARDAALRAIDLDENLAEAHAALAAVRAAYDWDWSAGESEYRRALELNPNLAQTRVLFAAVLVLKGDFAHAYEQVACAQQLDPLSLPIKTGAGWVYWWDRKFDRAIEQWESVLELEPRFALAHYNLGMVYAKKGMYEDAIAEHKKALEFGGEDPHWLAALGRAYGLAGRRAEAEGILLQLQKLSRSKYVSSYVIAGVHLALGDTDRALGSLEKAYEERDPLLTNLKREWFNWEPLRSDPQFQELVLRMHFPK